MYRWLIGPAQVFVHRSVRCPSGTSSRKTSKDDLLQWRRLAAEHMFHYASAGFDPKPKIHYCQHLPQHVERCGVPRTFWVYSDESKNREIKNLWGVVSKRHSVFQQVLLRLEWWDALDRILQQRKRKDWLPGACHILMCALALMPAPLSFLYVQPTKAKTAQDGSRNKRELCSRVYSCLSVSIRV